MNLATATILTLFLPLVGGFLALTFKREYYAILGIGAGFVSSVFLTVSKVDFKWSKEWLPGYELSVQVDSVSFILISLVLLISLLVHFFSLEYMREDRGKQRYFAKLGFFTFSMIGLLMANHLILLFVFWELVGLASYLLIGFWYRKEGIPSSARMAFMVNRIADVALLAGILILNSQVTIQISEMNATWLFLPSTLVAIGAFGKSAQLPFSGWLTKAMVGPTPVSALIHAATMVAAGVYLLYRVAPFLHADTLVVIALVGAATAFYGGICALFLDDIKKVLAYSTISQLGYMVLGIGVGGAGASLFHLFTHAFFKAGLFLGAGAIIHFMHKVTAQDAQDMRNMGGLKKQLPWVFRAFIICSMALAGLPFFSGFMSKEAIILSAWRWADQLGTWAYIIPDFALITAFLTALYVGRMVLLVFFGISRIEFKNTYQESNAIKLPLICLALGSLWIAFNWNPLASESWFHSFWMRRGDFSEGSMIITFLSVLMVVAGLVLSYGLFKPESIYAKNYINLKGRFATAQNGFYMVWLYERMGLVFSFVAKQMHTLDRRVIDGIVHLLGVSTVVFSKTIALVDRFAVDGPVNGVAYLSEFIGKRFAGINSRDTQTQLAWLLVGVILILSWILFF